MNGEDDRHIPVLEHELVAAVVREHDGVYVDCTFGRGGHAEAVLARAGAHARVIGIDRDPQAIAYGERLVRDEPRLQLRHGRFSQLAQLTQSLHGQIDAVYLDLGASSPQLDDARRGFSFMREGPLDMRMNPQDELSASQWLARASMADIERVIRHYGEERYARRIARAIVAARVASPIESTQALAALVLGALPAAARGTKIHPATRTFQAIRMHINSELSELDQVLEQALEVLKPGGRLAVISFHSLEDRRVKRFMRQHSNPPAPSRHLPMPSARPASRLQRVRALIMPSAEEVARNPRSRSARLRVAERGA